MFLVRNNSNGKIIFGDLNIILNQNETLDLETKTTIQKIKGSSSLSSAIGKNLITVLREEVTVKEEPIDIDKIVSDKVNSEMDKIKSNNNLESKIDLIIEALKNNQNTVQSATSANLSAEEDNTIDDSKLKEIHKKFVERITKNTTGNITTQSKNENVDIKSDELENLI